MKKNFDFERIAKHYDPENDVGSPSVTWAEKALYDAVKVLSLRVRKLETQIVPEVIPPDLKLFVWTEVLTDHTDVIIFALAHNVEEAREVVVRDKEDWIDMDEIFEKEPLVVTSAQGFTLYGGG